jgi:PAS domain S-box-containing protein
MLSTARAVGEKFADTHVDFTHAFCYWSKPQSDKGRNRMPNSNGFEETLRRSEIRYRRLFETAQDGILILDGSSGSIIDVNPFLLFLLGFTPEEFLGKKLWELDAFQDIETNNDPFTALLKNDYLRYDDLPLKTKNGRVVAVEFVSNVYMVERVKMIQCNIRETAPRNMAALQLQKVEAKHGKHFRPSQKLESLSTLTRGAVHEFNNVLATVLLSAEMIANRADDRAKIVVNAARIIQAVKRGAVIVKQLSIRARADVGKI